MGLEDSSRFWSIAMALEHMVIVGKGISEGLAELTAGNLPDYKVDIAKLKPFGTMTGKESIELFKKFSIEDYRKMVLSITDLSSDLKLAHPWFGMFNAKQWFWLLSIHHGLHLKQIRGIKKRLSVVQKGG